MKFAKWKTLEQNLWSSKKISRIQIIVMLMIDANPKQDLKIWFEANALVNATGKSAKILHAAMAFTSFTVFIILNNQLVQLVRGI